MKKTVSVILSTGEKAVAIHDPGIDSLIFAADLKWDDHSGNWNAYQKLAQQSAERFALSDEILLKDILYVYRDHITDQAALTQAAIWADHLASTYEGL